MLTLSVRYWLRSVFFAAIRHWCSLTPNSMQAGAALPTREKSRISRPSMRAYRSRLGADGCFASMTCALVSNSSGE